MSRQVTRKQQLECARRELAKREKFYPKWIREQKLNPHVAAAELAAMEAIVSSLEMLVCLEEISLEMIATAEAAKKDLALSFQAGRDTEIPG